MNSYYITISEKLKLTCTRILFLLSILMFSNMAGPFYLSLVVCHLTGIVENRTERFLKRLILINSFIIVIILKLI